MAPTEIVRAVCVYLYNTSAVEYVRDMYGDDIHPEYHREKVDTYLRSQIRALGELDDGNFTRFVELALERYGRRES